MELDKLEKLLQILQAYSVTEYPTEHGTISLQPIDRSQYVAHEVDDSDFEIKFDELKIEPAN